MQTPIFPDDYADSHELSDTPHLQLPTGECQ